MSDIRRQLPAVHELLDHAEVVPLERLYGRAVVRVQARALLAEIRSAVGVEPDDAREIARRIEHIPVDLGARLRARFGAPLQRVINATGVVVHTNLGRSPWPREVAEAMPEWLSGYVDLEMELASGERSDRCTRTAGLLVAATGAESATVVNNNAAALLLLVSTLASGRQVVVSRGELVEIGGSFRLPDLLRQAGAGLVEVGTTNRTRLRDYEDAVGEETGLFLKVHPSNFRVVGFVEEVSAADLVALGRRVGVPVVVDEGAGLLQPSARGPLAEHPSLAELVEAGVDAACGSGDKVLGGPQAGLIVGRRDLVARCRSHPLYRALRPDRAGLAALEAVLRRHLAGEPAPLERLWPDTDLHRGRLERLAARLGAEVVPVEGFLGGGSGAERPVPGLGLALPDSGLSLADLRSGVPPVVAYARQGRIVFDLRTVDVEDDEALVRAVERARGS